VAGCRRGREVPEVGSEPEDRLPVKKANARGVSGRRGGRLPPWPDGDQGGRVADKGPSATVAGGPSFVRASVVMTLPKGAERVARLWAVRGPSAGEGWWRPEVRPGFVIMPLPEAAEAGSDVLGGQWDVCWKAVFWPGGAFRLLRGKSPCYRAFGVWCSCPALGPRSPPEPSGRSKEMGAGQMNPVGQDADMQKAALRVERPPCKVFPGSSAFCRAGSVQPVGNAVQTDQVVNRLTWADDGEVIALDQNFGRQGTGVVGR